MKKLNIICNWNVSILPEDMEENTIYLDGSCKGYSHNAEFNAISFDHHSGCNRFTTYATCVQVMHAILMGLDVSSFDDVVIDDIDADTVLSIWLLQNPEKAQLKEVQSVVNQVGLVDAHFSNAFPIHPLHSNITRPYKEKNTEELLGHYFDLVSRYFDGEYEPIVQEPRLGTFMGITNNGNFIVKNTTFSAMYEAFDLVLGFSDMGKSSSGEDTFMYTLGKKSDFVQGDFSKIFNKLAVKESETTILPEFLTKNWGGGSSIGGSARYADQSCSRLKTDIVLSVIREVVFD